MTVSLFMRTVFPVDPFRREEFFELLHGREIMLVRAVEIFAVPFEAGVVPAYARSRRINKAFLFFAEVRAGSPEFDVPLVFMVNENVDALVGEVPPDMVIVRFACRPSNFDRDIGAAPRSAGIAWQHFSGFLVGFSRSRQWLHEGLR